MKASRQYIIWGKSQSGKVYPKQLLAGYLNDLITQYCFARPDLWPHGKIYVIKVEEIKEFTSVESRSLADIPFTIKGN